VFESGGSDDHFGYYVTADHLFEDGRSSDHCPIGM
jgi:hypothetical protein